MKLTVGQTVQIGGRAYKVCSLTALDDVYCIAAGNGWFHAHISIIRI